MNRKKLIIKIKQNDTPALPLSLAVQYGSLIFLSGTVSTDLETGEPLLGTVEFETERIIKNIETILEAAGSSLDCVLKTQVFLTDISYFQKMNEVYRIYFPQDQPARSTVGIKLAGDYKLEIEAVAYVPES